MSQQTLSGMYPGFPPYLHQNLQSMYMQPLLQQCLSSTSPLLQQCLFPLTQLQPTAYPPYLPNTPTSGAGEVDEPNRDTSLSPAAGMVVVECRLWLASASAVPPMAPSRSTDGRLICLARTLRAGRGGRWGVLCAPTGVTS